MSSEIDKRDELAGPVYRTSQLVNAAPPKTLVGLVWAWILLRHLERVERREAEARAREESKWVDVRYSIHMVRELSWGPFEPRRVRVGNCPGSELFDPERHDYWQCSRGSCSCEIVQEPREQKK